MEKVFCRSPYNYDVAKVSDDTALECRDETLTLQSQREDADINVIMRRFGVTGSAPTAVYTPTYGDFTGVSDYRTALDAVRRAEESFMMMPARIRSRFENDPQQFVAFCSDPGNVDEMVAMGLAVRKEVQGGQERGAAAVDRSESDRGGDRQRSRSEQPEGDAGGRSERSRRSESGGSAARRARDEEER